MQEVKTILRQGGLVALQGKKQHALLFDFRHHDACKLLQAQHWASPVVLYSEMGMLQQYLREVPEIAWDLIEYSTLPTVIRFNSPGNVPPCFIEDKYLQLQFIASGDISRLTGNSGLQLAYVLETAEKCQQLAENTVVLEGEEDFLQAKKLSLKLDGEITIHR